MDQGVKFAALGLYSKACAYRPLPQYVPWHDGRLYRVVGGLITLVILIRFIGDIVVVVIIVIMSSPCWYGDHVSVLYRCSRSCCTIM